MAGGWGRGDTDLAVATCTGRCCRAASATINMGTSPFQNSWETPKIHSGVGAGVCERWPCQGDKAAGSRRTSQGPLFPSPACHFGSKIGHKAVEGWLGTRMKIFLKKERSRASQGLTSPGRVILPLAFPGALANQTVMAGESQVSGAGRAEQCPSPCHPKMWSTAL